MPLVYLSFKSQLFYVRAALDPLHFYNICKYKIVYIYWYIWKIVVLNIRIM